MSKVWLIIVVLLIAAVGAGTAFLYWQTSPSDNSPNFEQPSGNSLSTPSPTPTTSTKVTTHTDPAGFSFSYPTNFEVDTAADYDEETDYAKLSISNSDDFMQIWLTDTTHTKVADWLAKDPKAPKKANLIGASSLGGIAAEQYSDTGNLYTFAIDQGVLYYLVSPKSTDWDNIHEEIVSSFKFASTPTPVSAASGGGGETIYEEEETIE